MVTIYKMFSIIFLLYEMIAIMISTNQVFKHLGWSTLEFTSSFPKQDRHLLHPLSKELKV